MQIRVEEVVLDALRRDKTMLIDELEKAIAKRENRVTRAQVDHWWSLPEESRGEDPRGLAPGKNYTYYYEKQAWIKREKGLIRKRTIKEKAIAKRENRVTRATHDDMDCNGVSMPALKRSKSVVPDGKQDTDKIFDRLNVSMLRPETSRHYAYILQPGETTDVVNGDYRPFVSMHNGLAGAGIPEDSNSDLAKTIREEALLNTPEGCPLIVVEKTVCRCIEPKILQKGSISDGASMPALKRSASDLDGSSMPALKRSKSVVPEF
jgi:hypothetical protein